MEEILKKLKEREKYREKLLENIIKKSDPIRSFPKKENFLILARQWNSWYPSSLEVVGGCYFFNVNEEIIIVDPGFNTLEEIIKNKLDIRLIRHVFVTHFHPDHLESLTKLLTRLTSPTHKIYIYLNSTTFNQFKIYKKNDTEFMELRPGLSLKLDIKIEKPEFKIDVIVGKAFHREIGGSMNSVGLKFILYSPDKEKQFKIGFMSDTDGSMEYMEYYKKFYDECQILIPHLGSVRKFPTGYKHLYLSGVEELLKNISNKNKVIFLGEFGFELANDTLFYKGLSRVFPEHISYNILIKSIYNFLNKEDITLDEEKKLLMGKLLAKRFESLMNKIIQTNNFRLILEIILPLIILDADLQEKDDIYEGCRDIIEEKLTPVFETFHTIISEDSFKEIWWGFLKFAVFEIDEISNIRKKIEENMDIWGLTNLRVQFNEFITKFIPYLSKNFKARLKKELIRCFAFIHGNRKSNLEQILPNMIDLHVNIAPNHYLEDIENFSGLRNFTNFFKKNKWELFNSIFYAYFLIRLVEIEKNFKERNSLDGREIICKYLSETTKHLVLPVHPSYKILFSFGKEIQLKGHCDDFKHFDIVSIKDFNKNWKIEHKSKDNEEFINIIQNENCKMCKEWILEAEAMKGPEPPEDYYERAAYEESSYFEWHEKIVLNINDLEQFIYCFDEKQDYFITNLNDDLVFNKLLELIGKDFNPFEGLIDKSDYFIEIYDKGSDFFEELALIHPNLLIYEKIMQLVEERIRNRTEVEFIDMIFAIFKNFFVFKDDNYYKIFDNVRLVNLIKPIVNKSDNKIKFNFVIESIEYLSVKIRKKIGKIKNNNFFRLFKKIFIEAFYPLVENPEEHIIEYNRLIKKKNIFRILREFGPPFNNYAGIIWRNRRRLVLKNKI